MEQFYGTIIWYHLMAPFYGMCVPGFGAINLLLQKMEQFYGAIIWYHLMAPFYGMCVPGLRIPALVKPSALAMTT